MMTHRFLGEVVDSGFATSVGLVLAYEHVITVLDAFKRERSCPTTKLHTWALAAKIPTAVRTLEVA